MKNPVLGIKILLIQQALDFLPEASHMGRTVLGDFGKIQSDLFKVFIDEYGYGVFEKKHSTLFKSTLQSVKLKTDSHAYWQFYLTSTLLLNNLFHFFTTHKLHFFKYLGAIALAEHAFGPYCAFTQKLIKQYLPGADTMYYQEHSHIDDHHASMTFDILIQAIDLYGEEIIIDMVKGIESVLYLQTIADQDLMAQIDWQTAQEVYKKKGMLIKEEVINTPKISKTHLIEPKKELSTLHVHDGDELCVINQGTMQFIGGFDTYTTLHQGDAMIIKKNRLHGACIVSSSCDYTIYSIKNYLSYATNFPQQ
ncbi:MAG: iron-containing redox enzyme family protein [Bacteroidota bacterium]